MSMEFLKPKSSYKKFFNPTRIGENIEGNICDNKLDDYGNNILILDVGTDENGKTKTTALPAHQSLMEYYEDLNMGDYIYVELVDIVKRKNSKHSYKVYTVGVDADKKKEY